MGENFELAPDIHLAILGLRSSDIVSSELLSRKAGHVVCSIETRQVWRILKCFNTPDALEPKIYFLLEHWGISTLRVHALTEQSLLLEDLKHSRLWHAAGEMDMSMAETCFPVAKWY